MTTNSVAPVSCYPINQIFPKENYGKKEFKPMTLHYLIALGQPENTIVKWFEKNPTLLNLSDENHRRLTPLAVCVLMQNKNMTTFFLSQGADPTIQDYKGWTPLHHAVVLGNNDILQSLIQKISETVAKQLFNFEKGSYQDLTTLLKVQNVSPKEIVCYCHEEKGVTECSAERFQELTSATYCRSTIVAPVELATRWANKMLKNQPPDYAEFLEGTLQNCLSNPPKLSIGKDTSFPPIHGFDVFVEEDIKAFQGITFYTGRLESNPSNTEYLLDDINGEKFRNLAPMINDGFPNCMGVEVYNHGFCYHVFLAIRNLKKGEKLLWNYGIDHRTKLVSPHFELNPIELEQYVKQGSIAKNFKNLTSFFSNPIKKNYNVIFNKLAEIEKLNYLLETPSSMLYLLSKNLFPIKDMSEVFSQEILSFQLAQLSVKQFEMRKAFVINCCGIGLFLEEREKSGDIKFVQEVRNVLLHWSTSFSMNIITAVSAYFAKSLLTDITSINSWHAFKHDIEFYVKFIEALYNYCFNVNEIKQDDYIPLIKENFSKLSKKKKIQALQNIEDRIHNFDASKRANLEAVYEALKRG